LFAQRADGSAGDPLRKERERRRAARAVSAARGEQASAMAVALAHIGAAFDQAAVINELKLRIERAFALGPDHAAVRARYGGRAAALADLSLDEAIVRVERWRRHERKAFQIASVFGRATRLSLEVLGELRVMLRLMRKKNMQAEFATIRAAAANGAFERTVSSA
jgi:hypothetical protein